MNRVVTNADKRITLKYGNGHLGVDLGWVGGDSDNIYAHSEGTVTATVTGKVKDNNTTGMATYGNYIDIKHSNSYTTRYAHLSTVDVKVGDKVTAGQKIGYMGETGNAFGKHLHFEVRNASGYVIDATPYLTADLPNMTTCEKTEEIKTETSTFKVGDVVVPIKTIDYNGTKLVQYDKTYTITELVGKRAVLSARGQVWAAMNTDNIKLAE